MDRGAVVALHEVLDDEFPVGAHVVGDALAQGEPFGAVAVDRGRVAQPLDGRADHRLLEGRGVVGQAYPSHSLSGTGTRPRSVRSMSGIFCRLGAAVSRPSRS